MVSVVPPTLISESPARLWLGPRPDRVGLRPGVVVSFCRTPTSYDCQFRMLLVDAEGHGVVPPQEVFESFLDRVHRVAAQRETYWHCHRGMNRGGFAVAAYLVRHRGWGVEEVIAHLRRSRDDGVLRNPLFCGALREWYGS